jgi:hypothetical protein
VFQYHSVSVTRVAFQACSFNHSDISPSLESTTCERSRADYRIRRACTDSVLRSCWHSMVCGSSEDESPQNCVRPLNLSRTLTAIRRAGARAAGATDDANDHFYRTADRRPRRFVVWTAAGARSLDGTKDGFTQVARRTCTVLPVPARGRHSDMAAVSARRRFGWDGFSWN